MAYNLPSVFFVNDSDEGDNCILYHSSKRDEFNKTLTSKYNFIYIVISLILVFKCLLLYMG